MHVLVLKLDHLNSRYGLSKLAAEQYGLTKRLGAVLQIRVLDGQLEEMEYTLILGACTHMSCYLVPIITEHLQPLNRTKNIEIICGFSSLLRVYRHSTHNKLLIIHSIRTVSMHCIIE